jgi:hypothetical protein
MLVLISFAAAAVGLIIVMWDSENPDSTDEIMTSRKLPRKTTSPEETGFLRGSFVFLQLLGREFEVRIHAR